MKQAILFALGALAAASLEANAASVVLYDGINRYKDSIDDVPASLLDGQLNGQPWHNSKAGCGTYWHISFVITQTTTLDSLQMLVGDYASVPQADTSFLVFKDTLLQRPDGKWTDVGNRFSILDSLNNTGSDSYYNGIEIDYLGLRGWRPSIDQDTGLNLLTADFAGEGAELEPGHYTITSFYRDSCDSRGPEMEIARNRSLDFGSPTIENGLPVWESAEKVHNPGRAPYIDVSSQDTHIRSDINGRPDAGYAFQINASTIPEPSAAMLAFLGLLPIIKRKRN